jgi:DNA-binding NtrC family response regulator
VAPGVVILADDLIWSSRLQATVRAAGGAPHAVRDADELQAALPGAGAVIVDLTARAYDGVAAVAAVAASGVPVLAVGQHDDLGLRRAALTAGAGRVYAYRKLFEDGPATLAKWLGEVARAQPSP